MSSSSSPIQIPFLEEIPRSTLSTLKSAFPYEYDTLQTVKARWLSTPYPSHLQKIVSRIIQDRLDFPISTAISIGICPDNARDLHQFLIFSQIAAQLASACPDRFRIVAQDPAMRFSPAAKAVFEAHGCEVVEDPEAFHLVGENTFLFSAWCEPQYWLEGIRNQPLDSLALYVGNDIRVYCDACVKDLEEMIKEGQNPPAKVMWAFPMKTIADKMLDNDFCTHELLPCERPNGIIYEHEEGPNFEVVSPQTSAKAPITGFEMWWRPARNSVEIEKGKMMVRLKRAFKLGYGHARNGFPGHSDPDDGFQEFDKAYRNGLSGRSQREQDKIMCAFLAVRRVKGSGASFNNAIRESLNDFVQRYIRGPDDDQTQFDESIDEYLDIQGPRSFQRTYLRD